MYRLADCLSSVRNAHCAGAIALTLATIAAEVSCAGFVDGLGRSDEPALLRELSRAQRLVADVLRASPTVRSAEAVAVSRSQLRELSSALAAAQAVAASNLNTGVKGQTLRARVDRVARSAVSLSKGAPEPQNRNAALDPRRVSSPPSTPVTPLIMIDRSTLGTLDAELARAIDVASSS